MRASRFLGQQPSLTRSLALSLSLAIARSGWRTVFVVGRRQTTSRDTHDSIVHALLASGEWWNTQHAQMRPTANDPCNCLPFIILIRTRRASAGPLRQKNMLVYVVTVAWRWRRGGGPLRQQCFIKLSHEHSYYYVRNTYFFLRRDN